MKLVFLCHGWLLRLSCNTTGIVGASALSSLSATSVPVSQLSVALTFYSESEALQGCFINLSPLLELPG